MTRRLPALALACSIAAAFPGAAHAMDEELDADGAAANPDYAEAQRAVSAGEWDRAVELLTRAAERNDANADVYNSLGYAERHRGNLDTAFRHYGRALALDPAHRGAHEYVGEAYLMAGDLAKAEEHLAALAKLCFRPCEEHRELQEKIAAYKQKRK